LLQPHLPKEGNKPSIRTQIRVDRIDLHH
jgi:hypothetical protein